MQLESTKRNQEANLNQSKRNLKTTLKTQSKVGRVNVVKEQYGAIVVS